MSPMNPSLTPPVRLLVCPSMLHCFLNGNLSVRSSVHVAPGSRQQAGPLCEHLPAVCQARPLCWDAPA